MPDPGVPSPAEPATGTAVPTTGRGGRVWLGVRANGKPRVPIPGPLAAFYAIGAGLLQPLVFVAVFRLAGGETEDLAPVLWVPVLCGAILVAMLLPTWRRAAWLDGTTLAMRGITTRKADLARGQVGYELLGGREGPRAVPILRASSPGGPLLRLPLRRGVTGPLFLTGQLLALADAVAAGGPADPARDEVVESLRRLAETSRGPRA